MLNIQNNICIYGHTPEEHDRHLIQLMQTASKNGIVFNSSKCRIRQPKISFSGAVFMPHGMKPDPTKVQTLQDLPTPDNQTKLQSILGLINYLQPFIPCLSNKTTFLCEQLAKWDWILTTDAGFQCVKS